MALLERIFDYCERGLDPAFWAEPVNALTNVAFIAVGGAAILSASALPVAARVRWLPMALGALVVVIGIGSFLFHTFATRIAKLADVIPITIFMLVYLAVALRLFLGFGWIAVAAILVVFAASMPLMERLPCRGPLSIVAHARGRCLNGTVGYLPAWIALIAIGGVL
ncbi:MAG TPA: ceramidase domain-containing protein, partial [Hyphomicrobiaceae bacterium]|nr:ceramidase domain-containing protein [Hyphomicrobiaceae bacterium]